MPQEIARDEPAMNFAWTFVNTPCPARTRHVLDRHVLGNPHAAEQLHRAVGDTADHFAALKLDHRGVAAPVLLALIHLPRQTPSDPSGSVKSMTYPGYWKGA